MKTISTHELASILQIKEMDLDAWLTLAKSDSRNVLDEVSKLVDWLSARAIDKRTLARAAVALLVIMPMGRTRRQLHAAMDALLMLAGNGELSGDLLKPAFATALIEQENHKNGLVWLSKIGEHVSQTPLPDEQPSEVKPGNELKKLTRKRKGEISPKIVKALKIAEDYNGSISVRRISEMVPCAASTLSRDTHFNSVYESYQKQREKDERADDAGLTKRQNKHRAYVKVPTKRNI